ncbi:MAG: hypothetical protein WKF84_25125 [Pyrinomonadaceae bacterium]
MSPKKERLPKPDWLRIRLGDPTNQNHVLKLIEGLNLHTVCQEARCPNIFECWSDRTATFMLGGDICTRHCGFCAVGKGEPVALDPEEPRHVAEAVRHLNLAHSVITSVNRDDLPGWRRRALGGDDSRGACAQSNLQSGSSDPRFQWRRASLKRRARCAARCA